MTWKNVKKWFYALASTFISGGASALTTQAGLAVASAAGAPVQILDWNQLLSVFVSSGLIGAFAYLKQSPLPAEDDEN